MLSQKNERDYGPGFFYIFVKLTALGTRPDFHIVPAHIVTESITKGHVEWLKGKMKSGAPRKDTSMRGFWDDAGVYKEAWNQFDEELGESGSRG